MTCWPSVTNTSVTVPAVASVMVSLFFALTIPLPSTVEVIEPYITNTSAMMRRVVFLRFFLLFGGVGALPGAPAGVGVSTALCAGVVCATGSIVCSMLLFFLSRICCV